MIIDIIDKEKSLPELIAYLEKVAGEENPEGLEVTPRTMILISRGYLRSWRNLYISEKGKPPRLTPEGAYLLFRKWSQGG